MGFPQQLDELMSSKEDVLTQARFKVLVELNL